MHGGTYEGALDVQKRGLWLYGLVASELPRAHTTPESKKGSPKVNLPSRQWFSKVATRHIWRLRMNLPPPSLWRGREAWVLKACELERAERGATARQREGGAGATGVPRS